MLGKEIFRELADTWADIDKWVLAMRILTFITILEVASLGENWVMIQILKHPLSNSLNNSVTSSIQKPIYTPDVVLRDR